MQPWEMAAREAIRDLVARYSVAGDRGRFDDLIALFTDDGLLELPEGRSARGRDAIRAFLSDTGARLREATTRPVIRHHVTTHQIDVASASEATGTAYFFVVTERGPDHWGRYRDRYACVDGTWRFAHRKVTLDGWAPGSWSAERRKG